MRKLRRPLNLLPHEDAALRELYREFNIPTDHYPHRPDELERLVESWNGMTGRNESSSDVLHYMITRRKKKRWETIGRNSNESPSSPHVSFTEEDLQHLDRIHEELQIASDRYALDTEAAKRLQEVFAQRTGRVVPAMSLASAMIKRRKAGGLATLRPKTSEQDLGFSDIDEISM